MLNLTQQEYVHRIEELNQALIEAWEIDQRVRALKIAIQVWPSLKLEALNRFTWLLLLILLLLSSFSSMKCSKLLADTSVIQFYPSKFVLITDILDTFGKLVFTRIRTKADYYSPGSKVPSSLPGLYRLFSLMRRFKMSSLELVIDWFYVSEWDVYFPYAENFTPSMVPESAKETCRNWFYKIASIRELIPRLYVEVAILKSYNFLTMRLSIYMLLSEVLIKKMVLPPFVSFLHLTIFSEFSLALMRLTKMILGIGDPLVAVYARCYLCRVGISVAPEVRDYLYENLYDFLMTYNQVRVHFTDIRGKTRRIITSPFIFQLTCVHVQNELLRQKVDFTAYVTLYSPALDWILQCIAYKAPENLLTQIIDRCKKQCNRYTLK